MLNPLASRRRLSKWLRDARAARRWRSELRSLADLAAVGQGRRAFLLGSGPSLAEIDLTPLSEEFVCIVNTGVRALGRHLDHADMHVVNDMSCYRSFGREIEAKCHMFGVRYRFVNQRASRYLRKAAAPQTRPILIFDNPTDLRSLDRAPSLEEGVIHGSTVLVTAAYLLFRMGFDAVYVLGCDLDYDSKGKYFYAMSDHDLAHEGNPSVLDKRADLTDLDAVNAEFGVVARFFEQEGRLLANAGKGGNLHVLPRVPLREILSGPRRQARAVPSGPNR
jgi:hypothetical protein